MRYIMMSCALGVALVGCRLPPDREPLRRLPENAANFSYGELLSRLHGQANVALDAFFVDAWVELNEAAQGIDQTARFLAKTNDPPEHLKAGMIESCGKLQKEATRLADAARGKNVETATESLQRITLQIRQLKAQKE